MIFLGKSKLYACFFLSFCPGSPKHSTSGCRGFLFWYTSLLGGWLELLKHFFSFWYTLCRNIGAKTCLLYLFAPILQFFWSIYSLVLLIAPFTSLFLDHLFSRSSFYSKCSSFSGTIFYFSLFFLHFISSFFSEFSSPTHFIDQPPSKKRNLLLAFQFWPLLKDNSWFHMW